MNLPFELEELRKRIEECALGYGLDFFETIFEIVDFDQINEIAAYGGFPTRYPHWRFGMEYEELKKGYAYGLQKIYEMVINNDPCYAYLMECNNIVDQKLVMAHVYGHCDFFKNNIWFSKTNRKMVDEMANHSIRVRRIIDTEGEDEVETFIDICLSVEDLIDHHSPFIERRNKRTQTELSEQPPKKTISKLKSKDYMDGFVNPPDFIEDQQKRLEEDERREEKVPEFPEKDVILFLLDRAPLKRWQQEILSIIHEESYYFTPQGQTKVINEGWACIGSSSLIYTDQGLLRIKDIVNNRLPASVSDGEIFRPIYDWAKFENRETVWIRTRRGLELEGSVTHRLMLADGNWKRLDEIQAGDCILLGAGLNRWPKDYVAIDWQPRRRVTLENIAARLGVDIETVMRYRNGVRGEHSEKLAPAVAEYEVGLATMTLMQNKRHTISVPAVVDEKLGAFLGYLVGDGHISEVKRVIGLTTGDEEQADYFTALAGELFGVTPFKKWDDGRWRLGFYSRNVEEFLKDLGLKTGRAARIKEVPDVILRSPQEVVAAFLRAYFDCDGYAGKEGVILSTSSESMSKTVQLIFLNFGIHSHRRSQRDGCWHVHVTGKSATIFQEKIGFGLERKREALRKYIEERHWFKKKDWQDEIVAVERRRADVYDISVEGTHRYAAQGFINHNSYWHSKIMTEKVLEDSELIDYADHHSGTMGTQPGRINPYKLGVELLRDIEDRWNKGKFGKEYEECDDLEEKRRWDKKLGLGREKIFEVRRIYNDVSLIDTFLTEEFCHEQKMFTYRFNHHTGYYEIADRDFKKVKEKLLFSLTNFGKPFIYVIESNYGNRGELYLKHRYEGIDLKLNYARDTLQNLNRLWGRPVHLETEIDEGGRLITFDGKKHYDREIKGEGD